MDVTHYFWIGLAGGAMAFAHCLGMCGGFALHLSQGVTRWAVLGREMLWHAGKTFTYMFLGAIAGFAGGVAGHAGMMLRLQDILAYAAGGIMILMGLAVMGLLPTRGPSQTAVGGTVSGGLTATAGNDGEGVFASIFRQFFGNPGPAGALTLGLATGFLPCPIVIAFLALSAQSGSVIVGMTTMAAMGIGTGWSLLLLAMTGHTVTQRLRRWGTAVAGAVLILMGAATALRGTEAFHSLLGCPRLQQHEAGDKPCCEP